MIRGTLDDFALPEIIRLVAGGNRSGTLEIRGAEGSGRILFKDGLVCGAESDLPREPLGRKLIRAGAVKEEQLWSALERPAATRLGRALIEAGLATEDQVAAALGEQAEEDVVNVVRLDPLEFVWTAGDPGEPGARLRVDDLIEAITQRLREIEAVRKRIPLGASVALAAIPPKGEAAISVVPSDWAILAMLGTRRAVRDLLRYSGAGDVQTLRAIDRLVSEGLVEIIPPASGVDEGAREWRPPRAEVWEETPAVAAEPPPPPQPPERIIRLDDDNAANAQARVAPFEIAIVGAASRAFNALTESCLRAGLGGLPVKLTSYGIQELADVPPAPEVIETAADLGVDVSGHGTHRLAEGELRGVDLVLGLDRFDLDNAITIGGAAREHCFTMQEFATWAERVQTPHDSDLPVRGRIVVARANRGRTETIDEGIDSDARSLYGNSERALAGHIRTLCRTIVTILRGRRGAGRTETPPPPPPRKGSYQIG